VEAFAARLAECGVERILTGHCTGDEAFAILKSRLGERITQFRVGLETDI
jgi:7,8-dihydropterin-6-yl-methyl-4-(beta-D-ribofuranosyl)aminobenzene 5'-phosphate synthase